MDKETLKYIFTNFQERKLPDTKPRNLVLPLSIEENNQEFSQINKIISLVGVRRGGKTYLLYNTIKHLLKLGIEKKNIIYLNFEDDRLFPIKLSELDLILKAYYELFPEKINEKKFVFFDEIQNVPNWEKYIRRIYDTENIQIFITGSSSKLLSRDIATALRGRSISYEVSPLSFKEYLDFKNIDIKPYSTKSEAKIIYEFDEYLNYGGFPEVVLAEKDIKEKILNEYVDLIQYKDMVERYNVKNQILLKYLLKFCLIHPGNLLSVNKIYNDFKSLGISLSKNTLYEYLEYLQEAFIIFLNPKYERSIRKQQLNPKKLFTIDNGLMLPFLPKPMADIGKKLENCVFSKLRTEQKDIYYYINKFEIDFVFEDKDGLNLINVTDNINDMDTEKREVDGLKKGLRKFPTSNLSLLINHDNNKEYEGFKKFLIWKYLLNTIKR